MEDDGGKLELRWDFNLVGLSYAIAVAGALIAVNLMEQRRKATTRRAKSMFMGLSAVSIGGCSIWCMHFIGMSALQLKFSNINTTLHMEFDGIITVLSFVLAVLFVLAGLHISSNDPFFEMEMREIEKKLLNSMRNMTIKDARNHKLAMYFALVKNIGAILRGGVVAGGGVCVMHYLGMYAQRFEADMVWRPGIVVLSVVIACVAASAAFWIIFRLLVFKSEEWLRIVSALVMGLAVCGMHYTGMYAAKYEHSPGKDTSVVWFSFNSDLVSTVSVTICLAWSLGMAVLALADERQRGVENAQQLKLARRLLLQLERNRDVVELFSRLKDGKFRMSICPTAGESLSAGTGTSNINVSTSGRHNSIGSPPRTRASSMMKSLRQSGRRRSSSSGEAPESKATSRQVFVTSGSTAVAVGVSQSGGRPVLQGPMVSSRYELTSRSGSFTPNDPSSLVLGGSHRDLESSPSANRRRAVTSPGVTTTHLLVRRSSGGCGGGDEVGVGDMSPLPPTIPAGPAHVRNGVSGTRRIDDAAGEEFLVADGVEGYSVTSSSSNVVRVPPAAGPPLRLAAPAAVAFGEESGVLLTSSTRQMDGIDAVRTVKEGAVVSVQELETLDGGGGGEAITGASAMDLRRKGSGGEGGVWSSTVVEEGVVVGGGRSSSSTAAVVSLVAPVPPPVAATITSSTLSSSTTTLTTSEHAHDLIIATVAPPPRNRLPPLNNPRVIT